MHHLCRGGFFSEELLRGKDRRAAGAGGLRQGFGEREGEFEEPDFETEFDNLLFLGVETGVSGEEALGWLGGRG